MTEVSRRTLQQSRESVNYWFERTQWIRLQRDMLTIALVVSVTLNLILIFAGGV